MNLIDSYYKPGIIDGYTFVFDERDPRTEYYTMLATDETGGMSGDHLPCHTGPKKRQATTPRLIPA